MTEIFKTAKLEAEWIKYYCHADFKKEKYLLPENILSFYDIAKPIGYSKVYTPLIIKTNMGVYDTNNAIINTGHRNHLNGIYTCLEWIILNKYDNYIELIDIII